MKEAICAALVEGRLPCRRAFILAHKNGVEPIQIGREASRLGVRISHCQLGLFGYDKQGKRGIVKPAASVPESLEAAIRARLVKGRLPCRAAWEIAQEHNLSRLTVANAVEGLRLRISACQLGCFP